MPLLTELEIVCFDHQLQRCRADGAGEGERFSKIHFLLLA
jgi:hypothetical protein